MEPADGNASVSAPKSQLSEIAARAAVAQTKSAPGLGTIGDVQAEIDDAIADMRDFYKIEPDEVMRIVSAHSARLIEIIVRIQRIEVMNRAWKPVREEADKVLAELKSQFQISSRLLAVRAQDWEMSGRGQT